VGINKKSAEMIYEKSKLRKNDTVKIITGKNKGNTGRILRINHLKHTVLIEGQNMVKKAMRKRKQTDKGGISEIEAPVHISNVMVVCKKCGKPTKIGIRTEKGKRIRFCKYKKCNEELS
jgi:large subunit ribosomal protein L24